MTGVLVLTAAAVIYALICLARPHHACSRCRGTRIDGGRRCRACKGTGVTLRPGARLVHGFYQHVKGEPDRAGRLGRINRAQAQAEHDRKLGALDALRERAAAAGYAGRAAGDKAAEDDEWRESS